MLAIPAVRPPLTSITSCRRYQVRLTSRRPASPGSGNDTTSGSLRALLRRSADHFRPLRSSLANLDDRPVAPLHANAGPRPHDDQERMRETGLVLTEEDELALELSPFPPLCHRSCHPAMDRRSAPQPRLHEWAGAWRSLHARPVSPCPAACWDEGPLPGPRRPPEASGELRPGGCALSQS